MTKAWTYAKTHDGKFVRAPVLATAGIARGQAIEMPTWPPSQVVHACWLDDAEHDSGEAVVVAACGAYAAPEDVHETDAAIDCMTCLVRHVKYDEGPDGPE